MSSKWTVSRDFLFLYFVMIHLTLGRMKNWLDRELLRKFAEIFATLEDAPASMAPAKIQRRHRCHRREINRRCQRHQ